MALDDVHGAPTGQGSMRTVQPESRTHRGKGMEQTPLQPMLDVSPTEVDQFIERMRELVVELAAFPEELKPRLVGSVDASAGG